VKKTIQHPDGRLETVEGTAEEIAEYERKLRESEKPKGRGKKPVLHGAPEVDGKPLTEDEITWIRLSRAGLLPKEVQGPTVVPWAPTIPSYPVMPDPYLLQPQRCLFCGRLNCHELHIWCGTTTSDKVEMPGEIKLGWNHEYRGGCSECGSEGHSYCARD
jgi:hypothetical protein